MAETVEAPARITLGIYVGGEWRAASSGETYEKRNPMRPDEVVAEVPACGESDVDAAVAAAVEAFPAWSATPAPQRGNLLVKAAEVIEARVEQIAIEMTREMGKPLREARMETARAATIFRFFGGEGYRPVGELAQQTLTGGPVYTMRRPLGVVALIAPWNFPAAIPAWKLAPALAYGNTVVLKLATEAPVTGLRLAECLAEAGLPAGVLNVLTGSGSKVGNPLVRDPRVRAISFTGSVPVGRSVREEATKLGKRVQLELGGHNPLIVLADAKLDAAVEAAYAGAFWSAGQKCTATRRIYVQEPVYDAFRQKLLDRIERGKVGDPADPETEVGPIVNETQFDEIMEAIERGRS
jgi:aldehyde dehydrogenase (NAD+)